MTLFSMRAAGALLLAASLAACGGGDKATFPITGVVSGLAYGNLILKTNNQTVTVAPNPANAGDVVNTVNYTFPQTLSYGDTFFVQLDTNPVHQSCVVGQIKADSAGHTAAINIAVACTINTQFVSGYVTGLVGDGLQLINGSTSGTIALTKAIVDANATTEATAAASGSTVKTPSFTFPAVAYNQAYGVTILTQPAGQTCTVTNGTGLIQDAQILNILVNCVNNP